MNALRYAIRAGRAGSFTVSFVLLVLLVPSVLSAQDFEALREKMVADEIEAVGVKNQRVLAAMRATPRHEFVLKKWQAQAYFDSSLPIGGNQTISSPFIVAYMTAQLDPQATDRVLEIGTGSGYQAAVLSPLVKDVYTIEIVDQLARRAERTLKRLKYNNVHVRSGDGYAGWPEAAPFDKIIVTCSPENIPQPLIDQLAEGGTMIIPMGERFQQNLVRVTKRHADLAKETLQATYFVPMTGTAENERKVQPDPSKPKIENGDFEEVSNDNDLPAVWYYMRNARLAQDAETGNRYLSFSNEEAGVPSRALQGLALDGRAVQSIRLSARVRGANLGPDPTGKQYPAILITFYDERRAAIANKMLGPWQASFDWRTEVKDFRVPPNSREAIIYMGLLGGVGRLDIDKVRLEPTPNP